MDILYQEQAFVICQKPVGMDAETQVPQALRDALGGEIFTVHRLDQNVGGVMVYARTKPAAAELSRLIQNGQMVKEYVALVHGLPPESGDWTDLLFKDSRRNKVFVVDRQRSGVKRHGWNLPGFGQKKIHWCRSGSTPVVPIRSGYSLPPGGIRWWAITSMAQEMERLPPCCFLFASPSPGKERNCSFLNFRTGLFKSQFIEPLAR